MGYASRSALLHVLASAMPQTKCVHSDGKKTKGVQLPHLTKMAKKAAKKAAAPAPRKQPGQRRQSDAKEDQNASACLETWRNQCAKRRLTTETSCSNRRVAARSSMSCQQQVRKQECSASCTSNRDTSNNMRPQRRKRNKAVQLPQLTKVAKKAAKKAAA